MNDLQLFLPCAVGVERYLADEAQHILDKPAQAQRSGVVVHGAWVDVLKLNLYSRLAQRVLVQLAHQPYRNESDIYETACAVAWEAWFGNKHTFKIELTAQRSPLQSLNFAALKVKDAIADRFRHKTGARPSVDTDRPMVRVFVHLSETHQTLYIDTTGEPLFKRGWREDKGDAPLKETLAAAMLVASGWGQKLTPLYDPCCGSGTLVIEAAQMALNIPAGGQRRFGFERLHPYVPTLWQSLKAKADSAVRPVADAAPIFGSDVAFRMVDFAQRNAQRAGVDQLLQLRGGDALQRTAPCEQAGTLIMNPPYGERIEVRGVAGRGAEGARTSGQQPRTFVLGRESVQMDSLGAKTSSNQSHETEQGDAFFMQLARHWKQHFGGWQAWVLTPDMKLPGRMRMKETRRVPLYNGPIECRLFGFDIRAMNVEK